MPWGTHDCSEGGLREMPALRAAGGRVGPLRPRRGRFGTLLQQLECGIFGRTAVGTREAFSAEMPSFYDKAFGSSTPLRVAHLVIEQTYHCPVADADPELAATIMKGALVTHVRGYSLMSGTLSAAQVAEWLCCGMPPTLRPVLLSSVALAVDTLVRRKSKSVASSTAEQQSLLGFASGETQVAAAAAGQRGSVVMAVDALQESDGGAAGTTADKTENVGSAPLRGPADA